MRKFLLSLTLLSAALLPGVAQQRTETEAEAIAKAFMQNNGYDFNVTKSAKINKVRAEKAGEITPYFIFNDTQKGGFVIVGGQEGMSDILAYSKDECFNVDDMPPTAVAMLEYYAAVAKKAADYPEESKAEKKAAAKAFLNSNFAVRKNVNPLLGEIKFNQGSPYNNQCPELTVVTIQNGDSVVKVGRGVVGCSATAFGMIMRYWKFPEHSTGSRSYDFTYDSIINKDVLDKKDEYTKTSASYHVEFNYDEVGDYDWDNILPTYKNGTTYNDVQAAAVSKLLAHCGAALGAGYSHGGTGAVTDAHKYAIYFGYDEGISSIHCPDYNENYETAALLKEKLADELSQGRPMLGKGSNSAEKYNGHAYVVDGFDMNGLFHFNLGWDGGSNGFYEVAPVPADPAFAHSMTLYINIHPKGRLTPSEPTRRVVIETSYGSWNKKTTSIKNVLKTIDTDSKYGESLICIAAAESQEWSENYLPGITSVQGILLDRCDTLTGTIDAQTIEDVYKPRVNVAAPAQIDVDALYSSDTTMLVTVYTEFNDTIVDSDYRIKFVYTEDNVRISGVAYNYIARGYYTFDDCFPATIEPDKGYVYELDLPIPATVKATNNTTLVVMLIDGKTGNIVNANTVSLKEVNTWKSNNKPAFYGDGELLGATSTFDVYDFDEVKNCMKFPVRINNPWYQDMPVEVTASAVDVVEGVTFELKDRKAEFEAAQSQKFNIAPLAVDSSMMLYLNIADKFKSSESSVKLVLKQNKQKIAEQIVNFYYLKFAEGVNPYTVRIKGTLEDLVSKEVKDTITTITLSGRLCGNDFIYLRDSLPNLSVIDMRDARIVEGPGVYYGNDYVTSYDIVGTRLFESMNVKKVILPESATKIDNYAFNSNKTITEVVIGNNVKSIGNSAFYKCLSMNNITIPASVTSIGRQAFKDTPLTCVTCESETPATLSLQVFSGVDLANATLMVPGEAAVEAYKAAKQWKDFGNIVAYTPTEIADVTEEASVSVKAGKIVVANDAAVAIYTFTGKLVATGAAGEYALPAGNYIVKVGNKAVKVKL